MIINNILKLLKVELYIITVKSLHYYKIETTDVPISPLHKHCLVKVWNDIESNLCESVSLVQLSAYFVNCLLLFSVLTIL